MVYLNIALGFWVKTIGINVVLFLDGACFVDPWVYRFFFFFFLIDKQPNILEKAKKPHVYRGYTEQPYTRLEKTKKEGKKKPHPPSSGRKPLRKT